MEFESLLALSNMLLFRLQKWMDSIDAKTKCELQYPTFQFKEQVLPSSPQMNFLKCAFLIWLF